MGKLWDSIRGAIGLAALLLLVAIGLALAASHPLGLAGVVAILVMVWGWK